MKKDPAKVLPNIATCFSEDSMQRYISFIRIKLAIKRSGMSRSHFYAKMKTDKTMPSRVYLNGTIGKGPVGFVLSEFEAWLESLVKASRPSSSGNNSTDDDQKHAEKSLEAVVEAPMQAKVENPASMKPYRNKKPKRYHCAVCLGYDACSCKSNEIMEAA